MLFQSFPPVLGAIRRQHRHHRICLQQVQVKSEVTMGHHESGAINQKPKTKIQKVGNDGTSGKRLRDLPEWSEEFTENLQDTEVPPPAHISQDSDSERPTEVVSKSRMHSIYIHFPRDRNCEVCLRTKMPWAPCRRRTGEAVPRAEKLGDLVTADRNVLNEEDESRNNHRYAVVVQHLATEWTRACPCTAKTSQETQKESNEVPGAEARYSTFSTEGLKTNVLKWRMFMSSSMKAAIHLGPHYLDNFGSLQEYELRGNSELIQYHTEIDIGALWRDCECEYDSQRLSLLDDISIVSWSSDPVDKSKSTCLLRFRTVSGENEW